MKLEAPDQTRSIALCSGIIVAALYVVGLVSGTELRHVVQTAALWLTVLLGLYRVRLVRWLALPVFVFWLLLMMLIWGFLLGWVHFISGRFSLAEIAMTIVIGIATVAGIAACIRQSSAVTRVAAIAGFILGAGLQFGAFWISFLPGIANR